MALISAMTSSTPTAIQRMAPAIDSRNPSAIQSGVMTNRGKPAPAAGNILGKERFAATARNEIHWPKSPLEHKGAF